MSSNLKRRLLRGGVVTAATRLYALLINLALHMMLARILSIAEYGTLLICLNAALFVSTFALGGLNQGIIKLVAGDGSKHSLEYRRRLIKKLSYLWILIVFFVCFLGWLFLGGLIADNLDLRPDLVLLTFLAGAVFAAEQFISAGLRSIHAIADASFFDGKTGGPITKTFLVALIALTILIGVTLNVEKVLIGSILAFSLITPLVYFILRNRWSAYSVQEAHIEADHIQPELEWENILRFNFTLLQSQLLMLVIMRADIWIAGALAEKNEAAIYGSARWLILQTIAPLQIISMTIISSIAQLHANKKKYEMEAMLRFSASMYSLVTIPILLIMLFFGSSVITVIYGDQYQSSGYVLSVLAFGQILNCFAGSSGQALLMTGHARVNLIVNLTTALLLVMFGAFFTIRFGMPGLAWVVTALTILRAFILWIALKKYVDIWSHPTLNLRKTQRSF